MGHQDQVREFELQFGGSVAQKPGLPNTKIARLRRELISEEYHEVIEASFEGNVEHLAKELTDLMYVIYGTALAYGIDLEAVFDEVHRSNMTKVWDDGKPHFDAKGKVLKPASYSRARVKDILEKQ